MNENEANLLFGGADKVHARPGQIIFVTLAERGALVMQGDHVTHVPGQPGERIRSDGRRRYVLRRDTGRISHTAHIR